VGGNRASPTTALEPVVKPPRLAGRLPEAVQVFATHALPMWLTSKPAYLPATASVTSKLCSNRGLLIWLTSKQSSKHRSWPMWLTSVAY